MIYLNISNTVILNTLGVPVINSFEHLSEHLSLTKQMLYFLTYQKHYCYREKEILKKDKTIRFLYVPCLSLKVIQKWILTEILEKINVSGQAMAFVPRKNGLKDNAEFHKKNIFLLEMDITNFFGTITEKQVFKLFCNIGYGSKVAAVLTNLCTFEGVLPQGAVTSPYIANLVCYHLDARLNGYCSRRDIVYTRYADDLTFSSNNRILLNRAEKFVNYIVAEEGFSINEKKTRYLSNDIKKTVTGITINNEEVHVDKQFKRIIRSQIYNSFKTKNYDVNNQIQGKIAYVNSIENGYQEKIISYIKTIIVKPEFSSDIEIVNAFNKNKLYSILPDMVFEEKVESPFD